MESQVTKPFYINVTLTPGEYKLRLYIWEDGKYEDQETITINIPEQRYENISRVGSSYSIITIDTKN